MISIFESEQNVPYDIFLSYHWCYHNEIINLHRILTKQGFKVWLDLVEVTFGEYVHGRVSDAIRSSTVFVGFFCDDYGKCKNCELELRYALMEDKQIFIICLDAVAKETFENTPKHMNINLFTPEIIVNSIKPTNTSTSPNSFKFAQHMLHKTKINVDSTALAISKFLDSYAKKQSGVVSLYLFSIFFNPD